VAVTGKTIFCLDGIEQRAGDLKLNFTTSIPIGEQVAGTFTTVGKRDRPNGSPGLTW
jgi:hypothetical protein